VIKRINVVRVSFLLFFFTCISTHAGWDTAQRRDFKDPSGKVHASELLLSDGVTDAEVQIVYFSPREVRFQVVPSLGGEIEGVRGAVESTGGIAGINGGYFQADLSPLGLLICNGRVLHPAQKSKLLSGVFLFRDGQPEIIRARDLSNIKGIQQAIQCGPFLVERGQPFAGLDGEKVAARTFVFSCGPSCSGFGVCRSMTLAETGELLANAKLIRDFRISQALNLDGGSSTTLYAKLGDHEIFSEGRSIVSNYLIIRFSHAPE
jgi:exopolysaccharide biosynthesis protein